MRRTRRAYSLLEILLALALTVLLLTGLYVAVSVQMNLARTGRNLVERTTLARAVFARMTTDIAAATTLVDPGRYRRDVAAASGQALGTAPATTTTPSTTTPSTTTPSTTTPTTGTGATTGTTTTGTTTTGTTTTGTTGTTTTDPAATDTGTTTSLTGPVKLPIGVVGDSTTLRLMTTKLPKETWRIAYPTNRDGDVEIGIRPEDGTQLVSDLRVVQFWLAAGDGGQPAGLARYEAKIATLNEAINFTLPDASVHSRFLIAPEVKSLGFEYFDGSAWTSSWDSNTPGLDGVTPQGPPRAIRITLEIDFSETLGNPATDTVVLKTFRHVVAIATANGAPTIVPEEPGTETPVPADPATGGTTTTPTTGM